jgi:carbamoyltransferase
MIIAGSKLYSHDSSLFIIDFDKKEIFAMSTERVTRKKHDGIVPSFILECHPYEKFDFLCHGFNGDTIKWDLSEKLEEKRLRRKIFRRIYLMSNKEGRLVKLTSILKEWKVAKDWFVLKLKKELFNNKKFTTPKQKFINYIKNLFHSYGTSVEDVCFFDHHLCHAIGAYYFSPFVGQPDVLSLTIDGAGDGYFSKLYRFDNQRNYTLLAQSETTRFNGGKNFASIGELYSRFTEALGFRRNSDEGKVEALAAFSTPDDSLLEQLNECTTILENCIHYDVEKLSRIYSSTFLESEIDRIGKEKFASTIQHYLEITIVTFLNLIHNKYGGEHLCLSGGVAANIITSLNIFEQTPYKKIYVVPFMGDEGISAGAAILKALEQDPDVTWLAEKVMPYYGNRITTEEIQKALKDFHEMIDAEYLGEEWYKDAALSLSANQIIAVVHGRMEFGPRALGNRSILANPTHPEIRRMINLKVKRRPEYQPFCPSILEEERERLFEQSFPHKHMAIAFRVKPEHHDKIPSAVHVDGTARPQFVEESDNPDYYNLLKEQELHRLRCRHQHILQSSWPYNRAHCRRCHRRLSGL